MEKYIKIAEKYLTKDTKNLTKGICFTIRKSELENSNDPKEFIKEKISSLCYDFSSVKKYIDNYGIEYLVFFNECQDVNIGREYEAIEDILAEKISNDSVLNIEQFLGYPISADVLENLEDRIREILDQMTEEELLLYEDKYLRQ